ncbi:MAG: SGNH/GDSL hydrolase family protein [Deltaproteobacteria bacterium]|nr:SGNH/GDSL hydrolase family protein [Deltaproteobacteria bacterium]
MTRLTAVFVSVVVCGEGVARIVDHRNHYDPNVFARLKQYVPVWRGYGEPLYEKGSIRDCYGGLHSRVPNPSQVRVLCLGGSTTQGQFENNYPAKLQNQLGSLWDVINQGVAGYSTAHSISLLAFDGLSWGARYVIQHEVINDLTAAYFPGFLPNYEHKYGQHYGLQAFAHVVGTPMNALFQYSHFYWWAKRVPRRVELWWRFSGGLRGSHVLNAVDNLRESSYGPVPPEEPIATFRRNLETLAQISAGRTQLLLVTQPINRTSSLTTCYGWKLYNEAVSYPPWSDFLAHHGRYNDVIRDVAVRKGVPLLDAAAVIVDPKSFTDCVHLTPFGNEALADLVAGELERFEMIGGSVGSKGAAFSSHHG